MPKLGMDSEGNEWMRAARDIAAVSDGNQSATGFIGIGTIATIYNKLNEIVATGLDKEKEAMLRKAVAFAKASASGGDKSATELANIIEINYTNELANIIESKRK
jgi:hypothetical protein